VPAGELPDYRPAFEPGAARVDSEDKLWIRTSKVINNGAVYDVLNRAGELIDRVLVPQFRTIIGFGAGGIVYMGVLDGTGARLEEARVR
jgi:sugar lactone lactonase YvrE